METASQVVPIFEMVPEGGFVLEVLQDKTWKYSGKQCTKTCKTKQGIKGHMITYHQKMAIK